MRRLALTRVPSVAGLPCVKGSSSPIEPTAIDIRSFHKHPESIESSQFSGIYFSNNGDPIPADVAKEMFIPFFSTKPSGSGIGLSISRQMLMMQSINLSLAEHNVAGYHVTFRME